MICYVESVMHNYGIQSIVLKALRRANTTLVRLFAERDPMVLVDRDRLLPRDDTAFALDLSVSRKATARRKQEQVVFGSSYYGCGNTSDAARNKSVDSLHSLMKSMRGICKPRSSLMKLIIVLTDDVNSMKRQLETRPAGSGGELCFVSFSVYGFNLTGTLYCAKECPWVR